MIGRVVSTKMKNTAVVLVTSTKKHPLYKKSFQRNKKFLVACDQSVMAGDIVEIIETKPISKNKHWMITKVIGRSMEEIVSQELKEQAAEVIGEVMPETSEPELVGESENQQEIKEKSISEKKARTGQSGSGPKTKRGGRTGLSK